MTKIPAPRLFWDMRPRRNENEIYINFNIKKEGDGARERIGKEKEEKA